MHQLILVRRDLLLPLFCGALVLLSHCCFAQTTAGKKDSLRKTPVQSAPVIIKNQPGIPPSDSASALAAQLADELKSIGMPVSDADLNAMVNSITGGGAAAMGLAINLVTLIGELKIQNTNPGAPTAQRSTNKLTGANIDRILQQLKSNKHKSLGLAKFLTPRFVKLKREEDKDK